MKRKHGPILFWAFTATDKIEILLTQSTAAFATEEKSEHDLQILDLRKAMCMYMYNPDTSDFTLQPIRKFQVVILEPFRSFLLASDP